MAIIKKFSPFQNLSGFGVFLTDTNPNSEYFRITELGENLTGGKNGFLIEGSECLKETTEIKIEILDVNGNPVYFEPGGGSPEYFEGLSKVVGVYIYEDTPIGLGKITILGELKDYFDEEGNKIEIPDDWKDIYNVKWEKQLNINRNLANESRVRFFKKPKISIEELSKPLFTKTIPTITQSGSLQGTPQVPPAGQDYNEYAGGVLYKLTKTSGPNFTSSIDENIISFPSINYFPTVKEVLSETEVLVDTPFTSSTGIVEPFNSTSYTSSFENNAGATIVESALTGSFAKIKITNLQTFVGDVARVKVFRKSRNETGDFQFVQEQLLESTELLKDITTLTDTELSYGIFDDHNLSTYWISGSTTHPITLDNTQLLNGVKIDYAGSGTQLFLTSESIDFGNNIEYNLSFKTKLSGSVDESKQIHAFLSSSAFTQSIVTVSGSADTLQKFDVSKNIISTNSGSAKLVFEINGDDWYISNVSLKNAQESSFSPDEFTLVQEVPRKLDTEFFDFKFEFYDINNNFIPVKVKAAKEFSGGNLTTTSNVRLLEFETDRTAFRFSSGSLGNPPFQQSRFRVTSNGLTGSITFASAAFDKGGTFIDPSSYSGAYPGGLTTNNVLTIASFSGSDSSVIVGSITYTASIEDKEEFETITRFEDGEPASALIVTSNQNQFFYKATDLSVEPSGQQIQIQAQRKNLASDTTTLTVNSGSSKPGLTQGSTVNGITTFTINATDYPFGTGNTTYEFSGSDEFGSVFTDRITVSPVKKLDGISVNLSNTNATFTANEGGTITGDLHASSGSVDFKIGSESITFQNSLSDNNRFNIAGITGSGVTPTSTTPTKNEYSISGFSANSGSLTININYKDGGGAISEFQQIVNYTKALQGVSGSDGANGASGEDAKAVSISSTKYAIIYDGDSNLFPASQPFTLSATSQNYTTPEYQFLQGGVEIQAFSTDANVVVPTDAGAYPTAGSSRLYEVRVREQGSSYDNVFDNTDVFGVQSGSDAFTVFLTNEAHVFSADSQSTVTSDLSDGAFEVSFFRGAEKYNFGAAGKTYSVSATSSSIELAQSTVSNQRKFTPTAVSGDSGSATLTITDNDSSVNFQKQYSFTLSKEGLVGADGASGSDGTNGVDGAPGPGVTYRGEWTLNESYVSSSLRRDVVQGSNGEYYLAKSSHTANNTNQRPVDGGSYTTYWDAFGATFSSVATDILFAQDVYANRTVNVGSSGSGYPVIALNADTSNAGTNQNPYIAVGGITSYAANEGIYIGRHGGNSNVMSLKGGASDGFLTWDGSNLNIQGAINITGGATADSLNALNAETSSLQAGVTNSILSGSNAASGAAANASGSAIASSTALLNASASVLQGNITTAQDTAEDATTDAAAAQSTANTANSNASTALSTANTAFAAAGASGSVDPTTGKLIKAISPSGAGLFLGADQLGYYAAGAWTSYLSSSGDFELSGSDGFLQWNAGSSSLLIHGRISGSQIEGGSLAGSTISVGADLSNPKFQVDIDGNMTCQDANVSGSIKLTSGVVGLWEAQESSSGGKFVSVNDDLILDPVVPEIIFKTGSETKLRLKPANEWASTAGTNISINDMANGGGGPSSFPTSNSNGTALVYGTDYEEALTATTYTIPQTGTYEVTVYRPQTLNISTPTSTPGGSTDYPNYSPTYTNQTHPGFYQNTSPKTHYFYFYLRAVNQTTSAETDVLVWSGRDRGAYTNTSYWEAVNSGYGLQWTYRNGNYYSATSYNEISSTAQQNKSITLEAGTYKFKYVLKFAASSGMEADYDASGNATYTYHTTTPSSLTYGLSSSNQYITIIIPSNVVELTSKGLQVLNDSSKYVQIERQGSGWGSQPTLIRVVGGKVDIDGDNTSTQADLEAKYGYFASGAINQLQLNYNSYQTTLGNVRGTMYLGGDLDPAYSNSGNSTKDMGSTSRYWDEIYADNFNNESDERLKENISGSELGLDFINSLRPVQYNFKQSTKKRTRYGLIAQEVSASLGQFGKTTQDFKGLNTGSSKVARVESKFNKPISEIVSSGSHYLHTNLEGTGSEEITQEWVDNEISESNWTLTYNEFISPLIKSVQELSAKVTQLENQISGSE